MDQSTSAFSKRLETLETDCFRVVEELSSATVLLREEGRPIDVPIIDRLNGVNEQIAVLCTQLYAHLAQLAPAEAPPPAEPSLKEARALLKRIVAAESSVERTQAAALAVLDRICTIVSSDAVDQPALDACQRQADTLREAITSVGLPELHPDAVLLAHGQHPFAALVRLAESLHDLDDTTFGRLLDQVEESFGRPLSIPLTRGRLALGQPAPVADDPPPVADDPPRVADDAPPVADDPPPAADDAPPVADDPPPVADDPPPVADDPPPVADDAQPVADDAPPAADDSPPAGDVPAPLPAPRRRASDHAAGAPAQAAGEALVVAGTEEEPAIVFGPEVGPESHPAPERDDPALLEEPPAGGDEDVPPAPQREPIFVSAEEPAEPLEARSSRRIARQLLDASGEKLIAGLPDLLVELMREGQGAQVYHVARMYEQARPNELARLPAWVAEVLVLAPAVRSAGSEVAEKLALSFTQYDADTVALSPEPWPTTLSLLLMAALPAAVTAPETGLPSLLQRLPEEGMPEHCREFCQAIVAFGMAAQPLDAQVIHLLENQSEWEGAMLELRADAAEYWAEYEHKELLYDPATDVWRNWTSPGRFIHRMITPILADASTLLPNALDAADHLRTPQAVLREVQHTDRQVIGRSFGPPIGQRALDHIRQYTRNAIALVRRWEKLDPLRPSEELHDLVEGVRRLREQVHALAEPVFAELRALEGASGDPMLRCAVACARRAVEQVTAIVEQDQLPAAPAAASHMLLHWPLLRAPALRLDEQWQPLAAPPDFGRVLLEIIAGFDGTWEAAIDSYHAIKDHVGTGRIIAYMETTEPDSARLYALRERRQQQLAHLRDTLHRSLDDARRVVDTIVTCGLLREDEVQQALATMVVLSAWIDQNEELQYIHEQIEQFSQQYQRRLDAQIARVREHLGRSNIPQDSPNRQRIEAVLAAHDLLAANEYISLAEQGDELPSLVAWCDTIRRFAGPDFRKLAEALQVTPLVTIIENLKSARSGQSGYQLGPITFRSGAYAGDAQKLLEAWSDARRLMGRAAPPDGWDIAQIGVAVKNIFDRLGFVTTKVQLLKRPSRHLWMTITTVPLKERSQSPVPRYGSQAKGRYRLLVISDRATEEDIIQEIADTQKGQPPIIIFYFGLMMSQRRRSLARLCREKLRTCVLIDDILAVFLSQYRSPRLKRMFEATLPFTYLDPYVTTAGIVPREVFYGRTRAQNSILDPMGTCFIYGGRQIGKTALLRHVAEIADNPHGGQLVRLIDLKDKGIGYDRPLEEIWNVIVAELHLFGVVPSLPPNTGVDRYHDYIENWLREHDDRQIILLLDEADQFLESDGSAPNQRNIFRNTYRIKGLMDRTQRRFKVVFAGLHNVQRAARQENNPLAHYGDPLCIGPLFEDNEWREARKLIEHPMASLGYRFQKTDLVTRILSQTNYYPSLLQLYGAEMIRYLTDPSRPLFPAAQSPPYTITAQHIEDVYQRRDLRNNLRHRFGLTIQLDPRYEVLTYVVADSAFQDEEVLLNGLPVAEIRRRALSAWAEGFMRDPSEGMVLLLLEELVGLGIFRRVSGSRFTLRNPNMLMFVGTQEEVRAELERKRELPPNYDAAVFRSAYAPEDQADDAGKVRRSPLTVQQMSELRHSGHGTSIVFGTPAAGLSDLMPYLRQAFGQSMVISLPDGADEDLFLQQLQALTQREMSGVTLFVVPPTTGWDMSWVERAHQRLARLTSRTAFARAVFIADPHKTWQLLSDDGASLDRALSGDTRATVLQPWQDAALHQWLIDCDIKPREAEARQCMNDATGNWPALLYQFYESAHRNPTGWQHELETMIAAQQDEVTAAELATQFGLTVEERRQVLGVLAELFDSVPVSSAELIAMLDGELPEAMIHRSLRWAELLNLVLPAGHYRWTIAPVLQRTLHCLKRGRT